MNRSTPGLPVHHQLPEFTQTHVHQVGDAIQPSHPLSSPSPPAPIPPSIRVFSNESTLRMRWQSTGVSALASFLPKNTQGRSPRILQKCSFEPQCLRLCSEGIRVDHWFPSFIYYYYCYSCLRTTFQTLCLMCKGGLGLEKIVEELEVDWSPSSGPSFCPGYHS